MNSPVYCCVHCGDALTGAMFLNPWLVGYEHRSPKCAAGELWYAENTMRTVGGLVVCQERETAVLEMRRKAVEILTK